MELAIAILIVASITVLLTSLFKRYGEPLSAAVVFFLITGIQCYNRHQAAEDFDVGFIVGFLIVNLFGLVVVIVTLWLRRLALWVAARLLREREEL